MLGSAAVSDPTRSGLRFLIFDLYVKKDWYVQCYLHFNRAKCFRYLKDIARLSITPDTYGMKTKNRYFKEDKGQKIDIFEKTGKIRL